METYLSFFWLLPMIGTAASTLGTAIGTGAAAGSTAAGLGSAMGSLGGALGGSASPVGMLGSLMKMGGQGGGMQAPPVQMAHAQPKMTDPSNLQALVERRTTKKLGV